MLSKEKLLEQRELLLSEYKKIEKKLHYNFKQLEKIKNQKVINLWENIDTSDLTKISKEDWEWILYHYHDETELQYKKNTEFLNKLGLYTLGFHEESKQFAFSVSFNQIDTAEKIKKWLKSFLIVFPYIKPIKSLFLKGSESESFVYLRVGNIFMEIIPDSQMSRVVYSKYIKSKWMNLIESLTEAYNYNLQQIDVNDYLLF